MKDKSDIETCRGFSLPGETEGIGLVKADIDEVSAAIARLLSTTRQVDVYGQLLGFHGFPVWQYHGHIWTIFDYHYDPRELVKNLSRILHTISMSYIYEKASDTYSYELFDNLSCVESYTWSTDITDELIETGSQLFNDPDYFFKDDENVDKGLMQVRDTKGNIYYFHSEYTNPAAEEILHSSQFLDGIFRRLDAWLPLQSYWPVSSSMNPKLIASRLDETAFKRVDFIIG